MFKIVLLIFACMVDVTVQLQWTSAANGIPNTAVVAIKNVYYCEVDDVGKRTGTTLNNVCEYVKDNAAKSSTTFTVLDNPGKTKLGWKYAGTPPSGAVMCNEGNNCYVGQSVYADGICDEYAGKIIGNNVIMVKNGAVLNPCSLKVYLIQK